MAYFLSKRNFVFTHSIHHMHPHYVVLVGDVGTGKSTIIEKLTGSKGMSSSSKLSYTRVAQTYIVQEGTLTISDTPGCNSVQDRLDHNMWVAAALNYERVSKILVVCKADVRMDNVVDDIRKYYENFIRLDPGAVAVLVTHMDTVEWSETEFQTIVSDELGVEDIIFSSLSSSRSLLLNSILGICRTRFDIKVNSENFLKIFRIHNTHMRIMKTTNEEVDRFRKLKSSFDEKRNQFCDEKQLDLIIEFQAWMKLEIENAKRRVAKKLGFTFYGEKMYNEAGHIANLANQMCATLLTIRLECLGLQKDHGITQLRRCPYCNEVWAKIVGCDGMTTCGNRVNQAEGTGQMSNFSFSIVPPYSISIREGGTLQKSRASASSSDEKLKGRGCGNNITWSEMAPVEVPDDFKVDGSQIKTEDISVANEPIQRGLTVLLDEKMNAMH